MGRFSRVLVVGELALSFGLLVVSALIIQSIMNIGRMDVGIAQADVWMARVVLPEHEYPDEDKRRQFGRALLARTAGLPGVVTATIGTGLPVNGSGYSIKLPDRQYATEADYDEAKGFVIGDGYFSALRVTMVEGRALDGRDREGTEPVAVVNRSFAAKFFPTGDAVGQRVARATGTHQEWRTIVGVVPDLGVGEGQGDTVKEGVYFLFDQMPATGFLIIAQASGPPLNLTGPIRDAVRTVDPNLPIFDVGIVKETLQAQAWVFRVFGSLFMSFGFAALFLATVGLYGVMSFSVSRRTQEIGIRVAMGANRGDVIGLVMRQGAIQVGLGVSIGVAIGAMLASVMSILMFQVSPFDPLIFATIGAVLGLTSLAACFVPARRAASVDPMEALRYR